MVGKLFNFSLLNYIIYKKGMITLPTFIHSMYEVHNKCSLLLMYNYLKCSQIFKRAREFWKKNLNVLSCIFYSRILVLSLYSSFIYS